MSVKPGTTPPGPKPLVSPSPSPATPVAGAAPDSAGAPGVAPPRGERLEQDAGRAALGEQPQATQPASETLISEGAIYRSHDGEERLVWAVRCGGVEYFARRDGRRWIPTTDRGPAPIAQFVREVNLMPE